MRWLCWGVVTAMVVACTFDSAEPVPTVGGSDDTSGSTTGDLPAQTSTTANATTSTSAAGSGEVSGGGDGRENETGSGDSQGGTSGGQSVGPTGGLDASAGDAGSGDGGSGDDAGASTGDPASTWRRRRRIDLMLPVGTTELRDVPVLVVLDPSRIEYDEVDVTGYDLQFREFDGESVVPHEVERWEPGGRSVVWVRLPSVTGGDRMWMYYGHQDPPPPPLPPDVWAGFRGVWHMSDGLEDEQGPVRDSTYFLNDGLPIGDATDLAPISGPIGGALALGDVLDRIEVPDAPSLDLTDALTIEGWVRLDTGITGQTGFLMLKNDAFLMHLLRPASDWPSLYMNFESGWLGRGMGYGLGTQWAYVVGTYDRSDSIMRLFHNGELVRQRDVSSHVGDSEISASDFVLQLGAGVNGALDEVRLSDHRRSADWIRLQYQLMTDTVLRFSDPEDLER